MHNNKKLTSATLFSKLNIESEHINAVNRTKTHHSTLIFLCFHQFLDKKVGISCPDLSIILKTLPASANHGAASGWPLTSHNSTDAKIRALDQPLATYFNTFVETTLRARKRKPVANLIEIKVCLDLCDIWGLCNSSHSKITHLAFSSAVSTSNTTI